MLTETEYHRAADATLAQCEAALEKADLEAMLEMELEGGALTLSLPGGRTYLVSKHVPSRQIWVSSPLSGGLHFSYDNGAWRLPDGRSLHEIMRVELQQLAQVVMP